MNQSFNSGAAPEQIAAAEAALSQSLPQEWRDLYAQHDGENDEGNFFLGMRWLPLAEVVRSWQGWQALEAEYGEEGQHFSVPPEHIQERYICRGWIPIAEDGGGNHLGIDLTPGPQGQVGQIINFGRDEETKCVLALSARQLWAFVEAESAGWPEDRHILDAIRELPLPLGSAAAPAAEVPDLTPWGITDAKRFVKQREIVVPNKELTDLTPYRWVTGLQALHATGNRFADLTPLSGLERLKIVNLSRNPVVDLRPLAGMPALAELSLNGTQVADVTPLASLPKLKELGLEGTPVQDVSPLAAVKTLRSLGVPAGATGLSSLKGLTTLRLPDAVPELRQLPKLKDLSLTPSPGADLSLLGELKGLRILRLWNARDLDLSWLGELDELHLWSCELASLGGLRDLKFFSTYESPVADLSALTRCPSLERVKGSFQQFLWLKDRVPAGVDFSSITGGMEPKEKAVWLARVR